MIANIVWDVIYSADALIFLLMWYRAFDEAKASAEKEGEVNEATNSGLFEAGKYTRRGTIYLGAKASNWT